LIKSGEPYIPPPSQTNPFHLTKQAFDDLVSQSSKDLVRTLASSVNLSGLYAEELCAKANVEKNQKASVLQTETRNHLYDELQNILRVFEEKRFQPVFVKQDATLIDILPFPFVSYTNVKFEPTSSFSRGLELFIHEKKIQKTNEDPQRKQREKLLRQFAQQQELIDEFKESISRRKLEADLIYLNYQTCETVLGEITEVLKQKEKENGIEKIRQHPAVRQFDPTTNELLLLLNDGAGKTNEVALDFRKSVAENAERKYTESKKIQDKLRGAEEAIQQTEHALQTLKESKVVVKKKQRIHEKHWWFERFRWFISSEGNIIVAGKDASSNDIVVKKYLSEGDRYAHADIHGAPSCVIKSKDINDEKRPISEKTLEEACLFAASYSRAWNQFAEASVYWVLPEQVSKTPESGEYVPKGAFIIRGKRNYHRCKLEVAVGRVSLGDEERLMGGPLSAVAAHAVNGYAILVPGVTKKTTVARILAEAFQVSIEVVEKVLPPGECTILKTIGFEL
jgi:predicted ribosome quality control (RQC) complex YloA/Tae2 family protein